MTDVSQATRNMALHDIKRRFASTDNYRPPQFLMAQIIVNIVFVIVCGSLTVCVTILSYKHNINCIYVLSNSMLLFIFGAFSGFLAILADYCARLLYAKEADGRKYLRGVVEAIDYAALSLALVSLAVFVCGGYITYAAAREITIVM
jgi:hypothetical protein